MLRRNLLSKKRIVLLAMVLFFGAICFGSIDTAIAGPPCEGDFDYDGDVDGSDLAVFAPDFGRTDCASPPLCEGDLNSQIPPCEDYLYCDPEYPIEAYTSRRFRFWRG